MSQKKERVISISVIIPTFNRHDFINKLLTSIEKQINLITEILIIDQSTKIYVVKNRKLVHKIKVIHKPKLRSPILAREEGRLASKGEILVFLDDDMRPSNSFFKEVLKIHNGLEKKIVGGISNIRERSKYEMKFRNIFENGIYKDPRHLYFLNRKESRDFISTHHLSAGILTMPAVVFQDTKFPTQFKKHILGGDIYFGLYSVSNGIPCFLSKKIRCKEDQNYIFKSHKIVNLIKLSYHSAIELFLLYANYNNFLKTIIQLPALILKLIGVTIINLLKILKVLKINQNL